MGLIEKFCKAFENNNEKEWLNLFDEKIEYIDCLYGRFIGKTELLKFYKRCHKEGKNYSFKPKNKLFSKDLFSFEWDFSFILADNSKKIKIEGCSFLKVNNKNKIIYYRDYADSILFLLQGNVSYEKIIKFYKKKYDITEVHFWE